MTVAPISVESDKELKDNKVFVVSPFFKVKHVVFVGFKKRQEKPEESMTSSNYLSLLVNCGATW